MLNMQFSADMENSERKGEGTDGTESMDPQAERHDNSRTDGKLLHGARFGKITLTVIRNSTMLE